MPALRTPGEEDVDGVPPPFTMPVIVAPGVRAFEAVGSVGEPGRLQPTTPNKATHAMAKIDRFVDVMSLPGAQETVLR